MGLHRPLWLVHQWHIGEALQMSCRKMRGSHSAAHEGEAKASDGGMQYSSVLHHTHLGRMDGAALHTSGVCLSSRQVLTQLAGAMAQYSRVHHSLQKSEAPQYSFVSMWHCVSHAPSPVGWQYWRPGHQLHVPLVD